MATRLERLEFSVGLKDQASGKLGRLRANMDKMTGAVSKQFGQARDGALGLVGTGFAIHQALAPAIDLNRALGELSSLGVENKGLAMMEDQAKSFAMQYGGTAAAVVRSSYDIQSAIAGLNDAELVGITMRSGVLAKATKAETATMTSYMGVMYNVWKDQADRMGKVQWADKIAGQTALAVKMFRTEGNKWSEGVSALGASAQALGISQEESFAVLGAGQGVWGGSESATKYSAFLTGALGAQKKLGLDFFNGDGSMKGIVDVLGKLRAKFGDVWDAGEKLQIKEAFGSDEAVKFLDLMRGKTGELTDNIAALTAVQDSSPARQMAAKMTDIWMRMGGAVNVLGASFGQKLLPPIEAIANKGVAVVNTLTRWVDIAPNLARWVGYGGLVVMALAGGMGLLTTVIAINRVAMLALGGPLKPLIFLYKLLNAETRLAMLAQWKLNLAFLANPAFWIVGIIVVLIAAVGALIYWWDDLKAAFMDTAWGQAIMRTIEAVMTPFRALGETWDWLQQKLGLAATPTPAAVSAATGASQSAIESTAAQPIGPLSSLEQARTPAVPAGGVLRSTTNQINRGNSRQVNIGSQTFNVQSSLSPGELAEQMALQAG